MDIQLKRGLLDVSVLAAIRDKDLHDPILHRLWICLIKPLKRFLMEQTLFFIQIRAGNISRKNIRKDYCKKELFKVCHEKEIVWITLLWKIGLEL